MQNGEKNREAAMLSKAYAPIVDFIISIPQRITNFLNPVLSDTKILKYNAKYLLIEDKLVKTDLHPNSVSLTLSNTYRREVPNRTEESLIDPNVPPNYEEGMFTKPLDPFTNSKRRMNSWEPIHYTEREHYILPPKRYVVVETNQSMHIPDGIVAMLTPSQSIISSGVMWHCDTVVQAGYRGKLTFSLFNANNFSVVLYADMEIAQAVFIKAQASSFSRG